jgi:hypothetical protein
MSAAAPAALKPGDRLATLASAALVFGTDETRCTAADLRDVNEARNRGRSVAPPIPFGAVTYEEAGIRVAGWLQEGLRGSVVRAVPLLELRELDLPRPRAASAPPPDPRDELLALVVAAERGTREDVIALVDDQIRLRRRDLAIVQRVMYVHHTAVQNAVDTVQTKRIEFLGTKAEETWVDGPLGALFFAALFAVFPPEALLIAALKGAARSTARILLTGPIRKAGGEQRAEIGKRIEALGIHVAALRAFSSKSYEERRREVRGARKAGGGGVLGTLESLGATPARTGASPVLALTRDTEAQIDRLVRQAKDSQEADAALLDGIVETVDEIAQSFVERKGPAKLIAGWAFVAQETARKTLIRKATPADAKAAPHTRNGVPLDIALKAQVQNAYAVVAQAGEDTLQALEEFRDACRFAEPDDAARSALLALLAAEPRREVGAAEAKAGDVALLVASATDAYEQLLWILVFGNRLGHRVDPEARRNQRELAVLAFAPSIHEFDEAFKPLLEYLRDRFYPELDLAQIALVYLDLFEAIRDRKPNPPGQPAPLDWNRFQDRDLVLKLIEDAVVLPQVTDDNGGPRDAQAAPAAQR